MAESLDTTAPLDGHDSSPMLVPRGEQHGGVSRVVAGVAGDGGKGRGLAGNDDCGARTCRSCRGERGDAAGREFGVGGREEAMLAVGRRFMAWKNQASGHECPCGSECLFRYEWIFLSKLPPYIRVHYEMQLAFWIRVTLTLT